MIVNNKTFWRKIGILLISLVYFLLMILGCDISYMASDDYIYTTITSGAFNGTPSPLTVYEGFLYGLFISFLYTISSGVIEWYAVVMHFLYLLTFCIIGWQLLSLKIKPILKILNYLTFVCFQTFLVLCPQFTVVAGELSLASSLVLFNNRNWKGYILSGILFFISSQIRFAATLMVFVPMSVLLFVPVRIRDKQFQKDIFAVLAIFGLSFFVNTIANKANYVGSDWAYYNEYNSQRGTIEQNICKDKASSILEDSLKRVEYESLCEYHVIDGKIMNLEDMKLCADYLREHRWNLFRKNLKPYLSWGLSFGIWIVIVWYTSVS